MLLCLLFFSPSSSIAIFFASLADRVVPLLVHSRLLSCVIYFLLLLLLFSTLFSLSIISLYHFTWGFPMLLTSDYIIFHLIPFILTIVIYSIIIIAILCVIQKREQINITAAGRELTHTHTHLHSQRERERKKHHSLFACSPVSVRWTIFCLSDFFFLYFHVELVHLSDFYINKCGVYDINEVDGKIMVGWRKEGGLHIVSRNGCWSEGRTGDK